MSQSSYPVPDAWANRAHINTARYDDMYAEALKNPDTFWRREAASLDWMKPFTTVNESSFEKDSFGVRWFGDGALNVSANCLDRHLPARANDPAIIWEGDSPDQSRTISFGEPVSYTHLTLPTIYSV